MNINNHSVGRKSVAFSSIVGHPVILVYCLWWKTLRYSILRAEQAWKISIDEIIKRNFNLDIKNPHVGEIINLDPEELLADYARQQADIQDLRDQLKNRLSTALMGKSNEP